MNKQLRMVKEIAAETGLTVGKVQSITSRGGFALFRTQGGRKTSSLLDPCVTEIISAAIAQHRENKAKGDKRDLRVFCDLEAQRWLEKNSHGSFENLG